MVYYEEAELKTETADKGSHGDTAVRWHWWKQEFKHNPRRQTDNIHWYEEENVAVKEEFQISTLKDQKNKDDNGKNGERETVDKFD